jgi:hyaluronate lyase
LFEHGKNPVNATYPYVVLPNRSLAAVAEFAAAPAAAVLENFPAIQAARHAPLGITAANFWNDGSAADGGITVDRKTRVAVQNDGGGFLDVAVSNPAQAKTGTITVALDAAASSTVSADAGIKVAQHAPTLRLTIEVNGARGEIVPRPVRQGPDQAAGLAHQSFDARLYRNAGVGMGQTPVEVYAVP